MKLIPILGQKNITPITIFLFIIIIEIASISWAWITWRIIAMNFYETLWKWKEKKIPQNDVKNIKRDKQAKIFAMISRRWKLIQGIAYMHHTIHANHRNCTVWNHRHFIHCLLSISRIKEENKKSGDWKTLSISFSSPALKTNLFIFLTIRTVYARQNGILMNLY